MFSKYLITDDGKYIVDTAICNRLLLTILEVVLNTLSP